MRTPFFSVIVPVYNVKEYLEECLNSILGQAFTGFELVLVDDGSTDGSAVICDDYANKDARIVVIHKENGGLSSARNAGLRESGGRYIWFLDSDDFLLTTDAFDLVHKNITSADSDVCVFSYQKYWQGGNKLGKPFFENYPIDSEIDLAVKDGVYKAMACNKVVRRSLVSSHDMTFPEGKLGEDLGWCADLLFCANKITFCDQSLMAYRQRPGSITKTKHFEGRKKHLSDTMSLLDESIRKHPSDYKDGLIYHYLACEYVFWLTDVSPYWQYFKTQAKEKAFLLKYTLSYKVRMANKVYRLFGLRCASFALNQYHKFKEMAANATN